MSYILILKHEEVLKACFLVRCQLLTPVPLTTWKAEIRRISVPGQPRQKTFARPHLNGKKLGLVAQTCHPSYDGKYKLGGSWSRLTWTKETRAYFQNNQSKKDRRCSSGSSTPA
jgi:hypothetical protein